MKIIQELCTIMYLVPQQNIVIVNKPFKSILNILLVHKLSHLIKNFNRH